MESSFVKIIIASTKKGVCNIAFYEDEMEGYKILKVAFSNVKFVRAENHHQQVVLKLMGNGFDSVGKLKLHIKGTHFQLKVWETLLAIPSGALCIYGATSKK